MNTMSNNNYYAHQPTKKHYKHKPKKDQSSIIEEKVIPSSSITNNGTFQVEKSSNGKMIIKRHNQNNQSEIQVESPKIMSRISKVNDQHVSNFLNQGQVQDSMLPFSQNFIMSPSREEMKSFSLAQLQAVSDFTLTNQHGKFIFHGPVDVRGADIDNIFHLQNLAFQVNHDANSVNKDAFKQPLEVQYFNLEVSKDYSDNMAQFLIDLTSFCNGTGSSQFIYDWKSKVLGLYFEKI